MKKQILMIILITFFSLVACNQNFTSNTDENYSIQEDLESLPNFESLEYELNSAFNKAKITDYASATIANIDYSDYDISLYLTVLTSSKSLDIYCVYMEVFDKWSVIEIKNSDNLHCYYIATGDRFSDIYDYQTDDLIHESKENIETFDAISEFNAEAESIQEKFEKDMEDIFNKYNISQ